MIARRRANMCTKCRNDRERRRRPDRGLQSAGYSASSIPRKFLRTLLRHLLLAAWTMMSALSDELKSIAVSERLYILNNTGRSTAEMLSHICNLYSVTT